MKPSLTLHQCATAWRNRLVNTITELRIKLLIWRRGKNRNETAHGNYFLSEEHSVYRRKLDRIYLHAAWLTDPQGRTCHFCGQPNDMVDDCGFWYINDPSEAEQRDARGYLLNKSYPACCECYNEHSWLHRERYGVGER